MYADVYRKDYMANIRVSDEMYEKIKAFAEEEDRSVGNAISRLIKLGFESLTVGPSPVETSSEETSSEEHWVEANPPRKAEKLPCCLGNKLCKHWVWYMNTGDGYVNTLTGEVKEV